MRVRLNCRDVGNIQCIASALLNVQRDIGDAVDFTDSYINNNNNNIVNENKKKKKNINHDSNIF